MPSTKENKVFFSWTFPEITPHERSKKWYVITGVIFALLLIYGITTSNYLFVLIVVLFALVNLMIRRSAGQVNCQIGKAGIELAGKMYLYENLQFFWIIYQPPHVKKLFLLPKGSWKTHVMIPLQDQDPVKIRKKLLEYIEEDLDKEDEPTSEGLTRLLKL